MAGEASSSQKPADRAELELGAPFTDSLIPISVVLPENGDVPRPLWPSTASPGEIREAVLGWLGRNSTHGKAESLPAHQKHLVFSRYQKDCYWLRPATGIMLRERRGRAGRAWGYTGIVLGRTGGGGVKRMRVTDNAHRLVCSLKKGPPVPATLVAQHACHVKRCINPACLSWGTQAANLATSADLLDGERSERCGACAVRWRVTFMHAQGRWRVSFMHAQGWLWCQSAP